MKLIIVIMTALMVQVSAAGLAQTITLKEKNASLINVIQKLRNQTGYDFLYDTKLIENAKKVNLSLDQVSLDAALKSLFENQGLTYTIKDKFIVIKEKEPSFLDKALLVIQSTTKDLLAAIDVRGRVLDEKGDPLPNASIRVKGKDGVANTNEKGEFVIKGIADDAVLIISYVGYKQLEIPVKGATMPLEIKLNQTTGELEEVKVQGSTGYQVIDKNHPGSFDIIDNELFNRTIGSTVLERIKNLTPGLSFNTPNESGNDNPYGILIRGRNSIFSSTAPLIVVDNFPYNGNIDNINPNDACAVGTPTNPTLPNEVIYQN